MARRLETAFLLIGNSFQLRQRRRDVNRALGVRSSSSIICVLVPRSQKLLSTKPSVEPTAKKTRELLNRATDLVGRIVGRLSLETREDEMRLKAFASIVMLVFFAFTFRAHAQQSGTSAAWNDNSLITVQKAGGDPTLLGDVKIEFYGHDAFRITSPAGLTVLSDPWRNDPTGVYGKWFLNEFPAIRVDIVLSTHAHFDHDAVERPRGLMVLERLVGQFKLGDIEITGLADKHKCEPAPLDKPASVSADLHVETCPPNNVIGLDNAIQIVETGGLRIAIWGDNRPVPDPSLDRYLKNVDVLILPVETVLTREEVNAIVQKYDPKAVIPSHYFLKGLTTTVSGLMSPEEWVNDQETVNHADVRRLNSADLTLNAAELKRSRYTVYYFGNHFYTK
jgi:L-ascorbate metabolism protein UlaG (beta-lactamase superfamily)